MTNIGQTLLSLRRSAGLSQRQLASSAGLSVYAVRKAERGNTSPDVVSAYASACGHRAVLWISTQAPDAVALDALGIDSILIS